MRRALAAAMAGLATGGVLLAASAAASPAPRSGRAPAAQQLVGDFRLAAAACHGNRVTGSYAVVTYGTKVIANHASPCRSGGVTLLRPGRVPLSTRGYTPTAYLGFGAGHEPIGGFTAPARFGSQDAVLVTASRDLQNSTAPTFLPPRIYLVAGKLAGDMRSVQALYGGPSGATCLSSSGQGCWLLGRQDASGTYDVRTHRFTLDWFSGQAFTGPSAGMQIHLEGTFHGVLRPVPPGTAVDLGTESFAAGRAEPASYRSGARQSPNGQRGPAPHARRRHHQSRAASMRAEAAVRTTGSPIAFVAGELLILVNLLALLAFGFVARFGKEPS